MPESLLLGLLYICKHLVTCDSAEHQVEDLTVIVASTDVHCEVITEYLSNNGLGNCKII